MKLYLAGPMRGYPEYNFPAFHAGAKRLRAQGHEVLSPAEMDLQENADTTKLSESEATAKFRTYMIRDLKAVLESKGVAVLAGWEKSTGALMEIFVGYMAGSYIFRESTGEEVTPGEILDAINAKILANILQGDGMTRRFKDATAS